MKVLHVIWDLGQGGAQTYVRDLIRQHRDSNRIASEVLALSTTGPIAKEIERLDVAVNFIGMRNGYDFPRILELRKYLKISNADIIHSHSRNFAFNWIIRTIYIPKIYTEHGGNLLSGRMRNKWAYNLFIDNYQKYIAISKEMAKLMLNENIDIASKLCVVYNGTDINQIDAITPIETDDLFRDHLDAQFRIGIMGRLVPQKGIDTFLQTAALIARERTDIVFLIVGDGPLRNELAAVAKRLGIEKRVFFLGFRPDATRILKTLDVFLFTSNYEPFGLVLTEAMAARVPIVALDLKGAVSEILEDQVEAFVVKYKDPALLADRIMRILDDASLRRLFTQNARRRVEQSFSIEENAKLIYKIYENCLGKREE
jgi:glycosyltransferase involved in cell wall biosynthesis